LRWSSESDAGPIILSGLRLSVMNHGRLHRARHNKIEDVGMLYVDISTSDNIAALASYRGDACISI
jgi:hypothetical protein